MNLHLHNNKFDEYIVLTSKYKHLPEAAVKRDYFIVMILKNLMESDYLELCVFKGGTSLSKCFSNTIKRFSEDIDLTYLPLVGLGDNQIDKQLKKIEKILSCGLEFEKIDDERNKRNKSSNVWYETYENRIKLEIGSSVKPNPYSKKWLKSYIHEFLENNDGKKEIKKYGLLEISVNVLDVTRTFVDKIMAVKRHAICSNLGTKVRHIYDVVKVYETTYIKDFLNNKQELKTIVQLTKKTDSFYLQKRNIPKSFNPEGLYDFHLWKNTFDEKIKTRYENLHKDLLYTDEQQDFNKAIKTFEDISKRLKEIDE